MPAGALDTVPVPEPVVWTVSRNVMRLNVAVTVVLPLGVKMQLPVPVQGPLQPVNTEPGFTPAASVTGEPLGNGALHAFTPQSIPAGALVTLPDPVPAFAIVTVTCGTAVLNVAVIVVLAS